jgi:hypothetical protein
MGVSAHDAPRGRGRRVFISHLQTDEAWAESIADTLRTAGFDVQLPREAVTIGEPIASAVRAAVDTADQLVVLISEKSSTSPWVRAEIALALQRGKAVVPVRVEPGATLPTDLARFAFVDATAMSPTEGADRVMTALAGQRPPEPRAQKAALESAVSPLWIPRTAELGRITEALSAARAAGVVPMVVLVGPAGVGKSTIARQFVATHQQDFPTVRWVLASSLVGRAGLLGEETKGPEPDLLVIEDVDSYHEVARHLPADPRVAVLLTSRTADWGPPFTVVEVGPLTPSEASDLLRRRLPTLNPGDASRLLDSLGRSPLALNVAASLLDRQPASEVLDELRAVTTAAAAAKATGHGSYYLDTDDPGVISAFERAFTDIVSLSGPVQLDAPERGSWKRRWSTRYSEERLEELVDKAERAAEVLALAGPEGRANRDNAEAIARLLEASSSIPNMVVASGSVLFIKLTDQAGTRVFSKTLTATELRRFEENQHLLSQPAEALGFLQVLAASTPEQLAGRRDVALDLPTG